MERPAYTYTFVGNASTPRHQFATSEYTLTFDVHTSQQQVSAWVRPNRPEVSPVTACAEFTFGDLHLFAHAADNATAAFDCVFPGEEIAPPPGCQQIWLAFSPPAQAYQGGTVRFGTKAWGEAAGVTVEGWKLSLLDEGQNLDAVLADRLPAFMKVATAGLASLQVPDPAFRDVVRSGLTAFEQVEAPDPAGCDSHTATFAGRTFRVTLTKEGGTGNITIRLENRLRGATAEAVLSSQELFLLAATAVERPRYLLDRAGAIGIALLPTSLTGQKYPLIAFTDDTWRPEPDQSCGLSVITPLVTDFLATDIPGLGR